MNDSVLRYEGEGKLKCLESCVYAFWLIYPSEGEQGRKMNKQSLCGNFELQ